MFNFMSDPLFPLILLAVFTAVWFGFWWGSRSAEDRIGYELSSLGRTLIGGTGIFVGRFLGYADDEENPPEDYDDGDPRTVEDLLKGDRK